jgi:hypothetical protein
MLALLRHRLGHEKFDELLRAESEPVSETVSSAELTMLALLRHRLGYEQFDVL